MSTNIEKEVEYLFLRHKAPNVVRKLSYYIARLVCSERFPEMGYAEHRELSRELLFNNEDLDICSEVFSVSFLTKVLTGVSNMYGFSPNINMSRDGMFWSALTHEKLPGGVGYSDNLILSWYLAIYDALDTNGIVGEKIFSDEQ